MTKQSFYQIKFLVAGLLFSLIGIGAAHADPEDIDVDTPANNTPFEFDATIGLPFNADVGVVDATEMILWEFCIGGVPPGATSTDGTVTNFTKDGITVTLPAGTPAAVPNSAVVTVTGTPTLASTSFSFSLCIDHDGNSEDRTYEMIIGRSMDLVFVLDRSGSMGTTTSGGNTRWQALGDAIGNFANAYQALNRTDDRFSITYFDSDLAPASTCCSGLTNVTNTIAGTINGDVTSNSPGGATAMGLGLQEAIGKLADTNRSRTILLYTDGRQNVNPMVENNGVDFSDGTSIPGGLAPGGIKVFAIGIDNPDGSYLTTLTNLANNNRGSLNLTEDGSAYSIEPGGVAGGDLSAGFTDQFFDVLTEFSPQGVARSEHQLPNDASTVTLESFPLNNRVSKLLVELTVDRKFEVPGLVQLIARLGISQDGTVVTGEATPSWASNFTNTVLLTFDFEEDAEGNPPALSPEGNWTVEFTDAASLELSQARVTVIADDHRLNYTHSTGTTAPKVNETLQTEVNLSWLGRPIIDASIQALVLRPGEDLGDLLANHPGNVDPVQGPDAPSPGTQKYNNLIANDPAFRDALARQENVVNLTHAGDGQYSGSFAGLNVAGIYRIIYRISGNHPDAGDYQRFATESLYVTFNEIDLGNSNVAVIDSKPNSIIINITPVTPYGRKIGPAMERAFQIDDPDVQLSSIVDHQDGSYTLTAIGEIGNDVTLTLLGQEVYTGRLENIESGGSLLDKLLDFLGSLGLLGWILLILLLLLLLYWIFRSKS